MKKRPSLRASVASALFALIVVVFTGTEPVRGQLASNPRWPVKAGASSSSSAAAPRAAQPKRLVPLRTNDTPEGSRVTVASDAPLDDYAAYREGDRFYVMLPRADATAVREGVEGRGFESVSVERRGADVLLSFQLQPGATARVSQKFNRLDVYFTAQAQTPPAAAAPSQSQTSGQSTQSSGSSSASPAPAEPRETPPNPAATNNASDSTTTTKPTTTSPASPTTTATDGATPVTVMPAPISPATPASTKAVGGKTASGVALPPEKANPVRVARFEKPPVIDGKLDDDVWKQAATFGDFYQIRPGENIPPSQPTEALMGYDAKFLYIAFRAKDEQGKVRATIAKRDNIFDDDWIGVIIDTFNDKRKGYELFFNPLGVQADGILTEGMGEDFSIDIVMDSKGVVTEAGYTVEIAIPFKSLRYEAGKDKNWGIHFLRVIKRFNNEQDSWMPISRNNSSTMNQAGQITGLEGISTERTIELIPSLTISQNGKRFRSLTDAQLNSRGTDAVDPGRFVNQPIGFDPGLTAKFGISPQMTLDLAINPDFAQVEADATVVTANQRFPIFFQEKRPFFLEGIDIFNTIISAVHTRAIVDPDIAVKLTGKRGRDSYGIMLASDNAPGNFTGDERLDPDNFRFLDKNAYIGVLRLKRDVGKENNIGLLATTYNFIDKHNHMGGVDGRFRFNKTTTLTVQTLASNSAQFFFYPDEAGSFKRVENGLAYAYNLNMDGRNWGYEIAGVGRSRFFRADVGFNRRFDTNNPSFFFRYKSTDKPKATMTNWRVYNFTSANVDWRGRSQRYVNESQLQLNFKKQSFLAVGYEKGYERVFEDEFGTSREGFALIRSRDENLRNFNLPLCRPFGRDPEEKNPLMRQIPQCTFYGDDTERSAYRNSVYFFGGTTPSKKYSVFVFTSLNKGVLDFDFGAGDRFPRVSPAALRLGQRAPRDPGGGYEWYLESNFTYQPTDALRMSLDYVKDSLVRDDTGLTAFSDNIFTLRSTYQFTRFLFARARVDYTTLGANARGQFLFGYTPNPGTALYIGYNDDMNRNGFNPFADRPVLEPGFRRNSRTFFIKASYLIRKSF